MKTKKILKSTLEVRKNFPYITLNLKSSLYSLFLILSFLSFTSETVLSQTSTEEATEEENHRRVMANLVNQVLMRRLLLDPKVILREVFPQELIESITPYQREELAKIILMGKLAVVDVGLRRIWHINRISKTLRKGLFQIDLDKNIPMKNLIEIGAFDVQTLKRKLKEQNAQGDIEVTKFPQKQQPEESEELRLMQALTNAKKGYHTHFTLAEILAEEFVKNPKPSLSEQLKQKDSISALAFWIEKVLMDRLRLEGFYSVFERPMIKILSSFYKIHYLTWASWILELIEKRDSYAFRNDLIGEVLSKKSIMKYSGWLIIVETLEKKIEEDIKRNKKQRNKKQGIIGTQLGNLQKRIVELKNTFTSLQNTSEQTKTLSQRERNNTCRSLF